MVRCMGLVMLITKHKKLFCLPTIIFFRFSNEATVEVLAPQSKL